MDKIKEEIRNALLEIYKDTSYWLSFAEAKNAALITLNSVLLGFCIDKFFKNYNVIYAIFCMMYIISLLISLISFIPALNRREKLYNFITRGIGEKNIENDNFLYYRDIVKYKEVEYYEFIQKYIFNCEKSEIDEFNSLNNRYEKNLVKQIISISKVTYLKYILFKVALYIVLFTFFLLLIILFIA